MTPKPEIAAILALKKPISEGEKLDWKNYTDIKERKIHNAAIDSCIATLENHVVIPAGEFAGIEAGENMKPADGWMWVVRKDGTLEHVKTAATLWNESAEAFMVK